MARFEKMLKSIPAAELQRAAGELLERLFPVVERISKKARSGSEAESSETGSVGFAASEPEIEKATVQAEQYSERFWRLQKRFESRESKTENMLSSALEELEAVGSDPDRDTFVPGSLQKNRQEPQSGQERVQQNYPGAFSGPAKQENTAPVSARDISEFFRRDSRRYDREFERY